MENSAQQQLLVEVSDFLAPDLLHRGYEQAVDDMVEEGHPDVQIVRYCFFYSSHTTHGRDRS